MDARLYDLDPIRVRALFHVLCPLRAARVRAESG
jgi:hypothetical protein